MDRRNFLKSLGALVGGIALEQAVPFGRVYSFPKELKCLNANEYLNNASLRIASIYYDQAAVRAFNSGYHYSVIYVDRIGRPVEVRRRQPLIKP